MPPFPGAEEPVARPSRTVLQALGATRPPLDTALRWGQALVEQLAEAHEHGAVPGLTGPACLRLRDGELHLVKFAGPSVAAAPGTLPEGAPPPTGAAAEVTGYESPEQLLGEAVDARSDLFSAGCMLFELFAGSPPFAAPDPRALAEAVLHGPPPPLPDGTPPAVARAVRRCLEKRPQARFGSARELLSALHGERAAEITLPTGQSTPREVASPPDEDALPDLGPRYRNAARLASGGMGTVYVAEDCVLHREVAIKLVRDRASEVAVARFEREALLSARLEHPGICPVHEFGRAPSGEPYLTMRRVRGEPLDRVIARAGTLEQRLALLPAFLSLVETVAYAHAQGVVHRDLKPSNALLGEFGEAVLIDWGLAKDLRAPAAAAPEPASAAASEGNLTQAGAVLGTPAYMSPQQASGGATDERDDLYALGAMLYHLLAGAPPYAGKTSAEVLDEVRRGPPPPLQERVAQLAPELGTIVSRAMSREPATRYASARSLADDLKAFQAGRLVGAHSYSTGQLLLRWAKRNALPLALSAAFAVVLAVSGAIAVRRVLRERDRANTQAQVAQQSASFLTRLFKAASPAVAQGRTVTALEVLDEGQKQIDALTTQPDVQAQLLLTMGDSYRFLGKTQVGADLTRRGFELRRKLHGPDDLDTLQAEAVLSNNLVSAGQHGESLQLAQDLLQRRRRVQGPKHPDTLRAMLAVAIGLDNIGRPSEAKPILVELLAAQRQQLAPDDLELINIIDALATTYAEVGDLRNSELMGREAYAGRVRMHGIDHPRTLTSAMDLADTLCEEGNGKEGEALHADTLTRMRRVHGKDHHMVIFEIWSSAVCRMYQGKWAEAEPLAREAIQMQRAQGFNLPMRLARQARLASVVAHQGRAAEARELARETLRELDAARGHDQNTDFALRYLGRVAAQLGDGPEALRLLRRALTEGGDAAVLERDLNTAEELAPLRSDPAFAALLAEVKQRRTK